MKVELGKSYKTKDGRKFGPMVHRYTGWGRSYCFMVSGDDDRSWSISGESGHGTTGYPDNPDDLISEWPAPPSTGTLAELDVNPGDVVEYDGWPYTFSHSGDLKMVCKYGEFGLGVYGSSGWDQMNCKARFRLISRASDVTPTNTGPVITETVKRIVPGVYGKVRINAAFPDQGVVYLGIVPCDEEQGRCYGLNRAELIAARDILSQLIDAMADE